MKKIINVLGDFLILFSSFSTVLCCALPALLVFIGAGASLAGLVAVFPQITWISEHKSFIFIFGGIMLAISLFVRIYKNVWAKDNDICSISLPEGGTPCHKTSKLSNLIFILSLALYLTGVFFAFFAKDILK